MRKRHITAIVLAVTILAAGLAVAQGPGQGQGKQGRFGGPGEHGPEMRLERMAARLDLTAEQQEAIKGLHEKNRAKNVELRKQMMRLKNELQGEMLKDDPSQKTVLSLNEKMGEIKTQLKANRLETQLAVRELLTPEQRDQMLMMREHGRRGGRGGEGHQGGHFRGPRGDRRGPGCDQGPCGPDRGQNRGHRMGKKDGTGPRAQIDCPQNTQPEAEDTDQ